MVATVVLSVLAYAFDSLEIVKYDEAALYIVDGINLAVAID